jgi:hypothetical protein
MRVLVAIGLRFAIGLGGEGVAEEREKRRIAINRPRALMVLNMDDDFLLCRKSLMSLEGLVVWSLAVIRSLSDGDIKDG